VIVDKIKLARLVNHHLDAMTTISIYLLGTSGSGKTTFIPCLYNLLGLYPKDMGFRLKCIDTVQSLRLKADYDKLKKKWLPSTIEKQEWQFSCGIPRGNHTRDIPEAIRFTIHDYPGGRLFYEGDDEDEREQHIDIQLMKEIQDNARALIGLIDGSRLLPLLQGGDDKVYKRMIKDMAFMMQECKLIYFLVTKWDILDRAGITLDVAREFLVKMEGIANIVSLSEKSKVVTRLIPVSSVGSEYANLMGRDGSSDLPIQPINIEAALFCILPDLLSISKEEMPGISLSNRSFRKFMDLAGKVIPFAIIASNAFFTLARLPFQIPTIPLSPESPPQPADKTPSDIEREQDIYYQALYKELKTREPILKRAKYEFKRLVHDFDWMHPDYYLYEKRRFTKKPWFHR
jgi:hypothetical protein